MTTPTIGEVETSAGFTPGPWIIDEACICSLDGVPVAQTCRLDEFWTLADDDLPEGEQERIAANARLIAAAPELYEALRWAASYLHTTRDPNLEAVIKVARAALAKASPAPVEANAEAEGR